MVTKTNNSSKKTAKSDRLEMPPPTMAEQLSEQYPDMPLPETTTLIYLITGTTPLLMNNPATMEEAQKTKQQGGIKSDKITSAAELAKRAAYIMSDGQLWFPAGAFCRCLRDAAVDGKAHGTRRSCKTLLTSAMYNVEEQCLLIDEKGKPIKKWDIDQRSAVNKTNNTRILSTRAIVRKWCTKFVVETDTEIAPTNIITYFLRLGGRTVGVGNMRPEKRGKMGKFTAELIG